MPLPLLAAAGIGAAGSLLGNLFGNAGRKKEQERSNKWNLEQWHRQNAYNDPSQQMSRLKSAGLNPNLIYGTGGSSSVGNAGGVAPSKAAPYNIDNPLKDINQFSQVQSTNAQTDNLKVQNTVLAQEAILKAAQTGKTLSEGQSAGTKAQVDKALLNTSINASKENLRTLEQNTIGKELDNSFKDGALKNQLLRIYYEAQNAQQTLQGTKLNNTIKQLEIDLKKLGIEKSDPWYFRILGRQKDRIKKSLDKTNKAFTQ